MDTHEIVFHCPLPLGLHARPASLLAGVAARFAAEVTLAHEPSGAVADARSVLALVALDVRHGDRCSVRVAGAEAGPAHEALRAFVEDVMPCCDEPLPEVAAARGAAPPRSLRAAGVTWLAGTPVSPGIGRGVVVVAEDATLPMALEPAGPRAQEEENVRRAVAGVRAALEAHLAARPAAVEAGILGAHLAIVTDAAFAAKALEGAAAGRSAGQAIVEAASFFAGQLRAAGSPIVRERAVDVEDIGRQLLEQLGVGGTDAAAPALSEPAVVAAGTLAPRQLLALDRRFLQALVLEHGGATSHSVVLARAFGIPTLAGVAGARASLGRGQRVVVDAGRGVVLVADAPAVDRHYERERDRLQRRAERDARLGGQVAVTRDGQRLEVAANVSTAEELEPAFARGADSIGLFRTEMLFMHRDEPPSEDEQLAVYARAAAAAQGRRVIIRTLDAGGDKPIPYLRLPREENPFLGRRGVRVYFHHEALFRTQVRAILRASDSGRVWLMLPMVATVEEVRWARARLAEARTALAGEGHVFDAALRVGIMVEVPAAAFALRKLAAEVDFFSVGTNDLAQYFLAADRGGDEARRLDGERQPAFLRLLAKIVADAHAHGRWIGMCGEMAREARNLPLLLGLGLDEISVAPPDVPALKAAVARASAADGQDLLQRALGCATAAEVDALLATRLRATRGLLDGEAIVTDADCVNRDEAIEEAVHALHAAGRTGDPQALEDALWAREEAGSTDMGHGFAVPHCRTDAVAASSIALVRLERPIAWGAADGEPVRCVLLLAVRRSDPDDLYLRVLAQLARRLMHDDFRRRVLETPDPLTLLDVLTMELGILAEPVA
jgi:fructose-specific PTS system IIA-like component